ncbi:MAG TPA: DNA replication/repair protein RecF [Cyclobacteriaceae bacterium]
MRLEKLRLINFKNYKEAFLEFPGKINCLLGLNGSGKTNLLDAIHYLSFTKSFLSTSDSHNIRQGSDSFLVQGNFDFDGAKHEVACQIQTGHKKIFREDGLDYEKISEHIGKYPVVLISPSDIDLIKEGSEERRKFFDSMIAQIDHTYLQVLMEYHHCLKQRNRLLRLFSERQYSDSDLVDTYDQRLVRTGTEIFQRRKEFIQEFLPILNDSYNTLVDKQEIATLTYQSDLFENDFIKALKNSFGKDMALQRTSVGIHRDDYEFGFAHGEMKKLGSQGQQKSFLVALKLANVEVLKRHKGFNPILLLDDIFDKLDDIRISRLLKIVAGKNYGQLFITDAGPERTEALLQDIGVDSDIFEVSEGFIRRKA